MYIKLKSFILYNFQHHFSLPGQYLYIEGSYPRQPGDIARIESFEHAPTKGKCFQFYYNMYGNGIGTLNIYLRRGRTLDTKPLWTLTGEQGMKKTENEGAKSTFITVLLGYKQKL